MSHAVGLTPTSTSEAEQARRVEETARSLLPVDLAPEDAANMAAYIAGRITLDELLAARARHGMPEAGRVGAR